MRKKIYCISAMLLTCSLLLTFAGCTNEKETSKTEVSKKTETVNTEAVKRDKQEIIEEMVVDSGNYGKDANEKVSALLDELKNVDSDSGKRWDSIMKLWTATNSDLSLNYDTLPDNLSDTDSLCLVALGFQLNPNGTMRDELVERLKVVKNSAEKYPNALIVCTGGGTAENDKTATEAGRMAEWLIAQGIDEKRVIVEDKSITTAQNAIYTFDILEKQYPQVTDLAIISSDYHIATGALLFEAESILRAGDPDNRAIKVVSNAAWKSPSGTLSTMFQAGALIELSGDIDTAFEIYYDTYDIHKLPDIHSEK